MKIFHIFLATFIFSLAMVISFFSASAQQELPEIPCKAPDIVEWNSLEISAQEEYNATLIEYEKCIFEYIKKHEQLMNFHKAAASRAINEWNNFVSDYNDAQNSTPSNSQPN